MKNQIITLSAIATILFSINAIAFGKPQQKESAPYPKAHQSVPAISKVQGKAQLPLHDEPVHVEDAEIVEKPKPSIKKPLSQAKLPTARKSVIVKQPVAQKVDVESEKIVAGPVPVSVMTVSEPAPRSEIERTADQAKILFGKLKQSLQNGATERGCDIAQRALNQC